MKSHAMPMATSMARKISASMKPQDGPGWGTGRVALGGVAFCALGTYQFTATVTAEGEKNQKGAAGDEIRRRQQHKFAQLVSKRAEVGAIRSL